VISVTAQCLKCTFCEQTDHVLYVHAHGVWSEIPGGRKADLGPAKLVAISIEDNASGEIGLGLAPLALTASGETKSTTGNTLTVAFEPHIFTNTEVANVRRGGGRGASPDASNANIWSTPVPSGGPRRVDRGILAHQVAPTPIAKAFSLGVKRPSDGRRGTGERPVDKQALTDREAGRLPFRIHRRA